MVSFNIFLWYANLRGQIRMLYVNFAMVQYPIDEAQQLM